MSENHMARSAVELPPPLRGRMSRIYVKEQERGLVHKQPRLFLLNRCSPSPYPLPQGERGKARGASRRNVGLN